MRPKSPRDIFVRATSSHWHVSRAIILAFCVTFLSGLYSRVACADEVTLGNANTGNYNLHITSYAEIPFRTVIRQQFDYSCGSAALATLLHFHYGLRTNEADVFKAMYAVGDQARIQKLGFSLLDMKNYLATLGYRADGYRIDLEKLREIGVPAIALIQIGSYKHFVVVKGALGDQVLIGDPALGLREFKKSEFLKAWNGVAFLIHEEPAGGRAPNFNSPGEWKRWLEAHPLAAVVVSQPLAPLLRDLPVLYQIELNQVLSSPFGG
jgi:uncharacterized protein